MDPVEHDPVEIVPDDDIGTGPVEEEEVRRRIETLLKDMTFAADAAGLKAWNPYRHMMRLFSITVRCSTTLLCDLAKTVRTVSADAAAARARDAKAAENVRRADAAVLRACLGVAAFSIVVVAILCLVAITTLRTPREAAFAVDLAGGDTGSIDCGPASRDARGDFHCSMRIVLKPTRSDR